MTPVAASKPSIHNTQCSPAPSVIGTTMTENANPRQTNANTTVTKTFHVGMVSPVKDVNRPGLGQSEVNVGNAWGEVRTAKRTQDTIIIS